MKSDIVTIIGDAYLEPICLLLEHLEKFREQEKNETHSGFSVNGFSVSICLLAVACLESYVMRVRFIQKANQKDINKTPVAVYLSDLYRNFPYSEELFEIYILRDIVTHNHLWELCYDKSDDDIIFISSIERRSKGDNKYKTHVDTDSCKTKKLGLAVNPIKIGKTEVTKVLRTMWKILIFLEQDNREQCYVSAAHYRFKGKLVRFGEVLGMPETCT